ncbi:MULTISPECIES: DJ-1/PfpI family protein [Actinoplanes]|uniref:DJ-1/PfpI family protein n=1 Tax=Actinoplanes TaxID=1865 RepID=UPI0005F2B967|nr:MULTISPECIES: DJ-1/PfpI family protein [Actinoplanes]
MLAQIVLFDGFDPLDVVAPFEVLHSGGAAGGGQLTVELVSAEGPRDVTSGTGGLTLRATAALDPAVADLIVVPGASGPLDAIPPLLAQAAAGGLTPLLKAAMDRPETTVATVCGGSMILAMGGLLAGRHVTTHHLGLDGLGASGAYPINARVVDDGDLISGGAVTSGLDVGLHLVDRFLGPRVAHAVEQLFAHERRGTVWRATGTVPLPF